MSEDLSFFRSVVRHSIVHRALLDYLTHCEETCRSVSSNMSLFTPVVVVVVCLFVV